MEYSPIKYEKQTSDPAQQKYFQRPVPSQFNFGLRWKPFTWGELDLTYQRGNEIGLNASVAFEIGNPLIPIYYKPYKERPADRQNPLNERIAKALASLGFGNIGVRLSGDELWMEAQNDRYFYNTKAVGIILATINEIAPPSVKRYRIILTDREIPLFEYNVLRQDLLDIYAGKMTTSDLFYLSKVRTDITETFDAPITEQETLHLGLETCYGDVPERPVGLLPVRCRRFSHGRLSSLEGCLSSLPASTVTR